MALKIASSLSRISSSPLQSTTTLQVKLPAGLHICAQLSIQHPKTGKVNSCCFQHRKLKSFQLSLKRQFKLFASVDNLISDSAIESSGTEQDDDDDDDDDDDGLSMERNGGRPGFISFYNHPYKREPEIVVSTILPTKKQSNLLFFFGPAVLVASFIFPSLYMRRILSTIFEDSLLTDFLILFFTEALFYCGVASFLLIIDHLRRPIELIDAKNGRKTAPQLAYRLTSAAILVLSLVIPMATMGLVWPWTGPAASATLAPYLVGIVLQFSFEQYAKFVNSPSWPVIPVIFQVYRLHQLNRAAQLVTALSMTVRGAEMTPHNLAINGSLRTLLNVLQFLGVICIWSLSSFLMRFLPSTNDS